MNDTLYDERRPVHHISLDLVSRSIDPIVHVVQYDDRVPLLAVRVTNRGKAWQVPSDVTNVDFLMRKPNGGVYFGECLGISEDRTEIIFEIEPASTVIAGRANALIRFSFEDGLTSTAPFIMDIDRNPLGGYNPEMDGKPDTDVITAIRRLDKGLTDAVEKSEKDHESLTKKDQELEKSISQLSDATEEALLELSTSVSDLEKDLQVTEKTLESQIGAIQEQIDTLPAALIPMGTITFEELPSLEETEVGWMYDISNEFTTTSDFREGSGISYAAGTNVYKTGDGIWDCAAGSGVVSVNGKIGNVEITAESIGVTPDFTGTMEDFEAAKEAGKIAEGQIVNITDDYTPGGGGGSVEFKSGDVENPTEYTNVPVIVDNEGTKSFREKVSTMIRNVRYLNSYKTSVFYDIAATPSFNRIEKFGNLVQIDIRFDDVNQPGNIILAHIPEGFRPRSDTLILGCGVYGENNNFGVIIAYVRPNGTLVLGQGGFNVHRLNVSGNYMT